MIKIGDRGQCLIEDEGVYLYTHWGASELIGDVQKALKKKWRWDDPEYLARIIFDVIIGEGQGDETGCGISTTKHGDVWRLITVNCEKNIVKVEDDDEVIFNGTFEKFLKFVPKIEE